MLALSGVVLLCLLAIPAQALVVEINLGWGYNTAGGLNNASLISGYNLQEGSIIQVIMYNSATFGENYPGQISPASQNFEMAGQYSGPGISAEPYTTGHIPDETTIYDPYTVVPDGHVIAYSTQIGPAIGGNYYGDNWYNVVKEFRILGTYDRLYLRVFGATEFPTMEIVASYWGLSQVMNNTNEVIDTWMVDSIDEVVANQKNYFEVIPEPGSLALIVLGGAVLLAGRRRRQKPIPGE